MVTSILFIIQKCQQLSTKGNARRGKEREGWGGVLNVYNKIATTMSTSRSAGCPRSSFRISIWIKSLLLVFINQFYQLEKIILFLSSYLSFSNWIQIAPLPFSIANTLNDPRLQVFRTIKSPCSPLY